MSTAAWLPAGLSPSLGLLTCGMGPPRSVCVASGVELGSGERGVASRHTVGFGRWEADKGRSEAPPSCGLQGRGPGGGSSQGPCDSGAAPFCLSVEPLERSFILTARSLPPIPPEPEEWLGRLVRGLAGAQGLPETRL